MNNGRPNEIFQFAAGHRDISSRSPSRTTTAKRTTRRFGLGPPFQPALRFRTFLTPGAGGGDTVNGEQTRKEIRALKGIHGDGSITGGESMGWCTRCFCREDFAILRFDQIKCKFKSCQRPFFFFF